MARRVTGGSDGDDARPARTSAQGPPRLVRLLAALGCLLLAVVPARIALSAGALEDSARAFARGDCATAVDRALDATGTLAVRPEPFALLSYCDVRLGAPALGVRAMEKAVARDPHNWEYAYGLALVRASAGLDPRAAARRALALNPREGMVREMLARFGETEDPREWRKRALAMRLPVD